MYMYIQLVPTPTTAHWYNECNKKSGQSNGIRLHHRPARIVHSHSSGGANVSPLIYGSFGSRETLHPKNPSSVASFESSLVLPVWHQLTQVVPEKRPINWLTCISANFTGFICVPRHRDTWTKLVPTGNTEACNGYYVTNDVTCGQRSFCLHTFRIFREDQMSLI